MRDHGTKLVPYNVKSIELAGPRLVDFAIGLVDSVLGRKFKIHEHKKYYQSCWSKILEG